MDNFTYETDDRKSKLENYEWDNVWWEQTHENNRARVLYIGDSISCGIRGRATQLSGNQILFDGFGTSKAVDNEYFMHSIQLFGRQQGRRDMVIFNNGLHGYHLSDKGGYRDYYEKMVKFLLEEFKDPVVLALSTSVEGPDNERVIARNESVRAVAKKYSLPVIDLYSTSVQYADFRCEDGVHYSEQGYVKLAEKLLESILEIVPGMIGNVGQ